MIRNRKEKPCIAQPFLGCIPINWYQLQDNKKATANDKLGQVNYKEKTRQGKAALAAYSTS